jgi:nucleotide-binding universal stress UspA family protein
VFKTILFPTDFSDAAVKRLGYVKQLRNAGAEQVVLLNVIHQRLLDNLEAIHKAAYFQDGRYHEDRDEAEQRLEIDRRNKIAPFAAELETVGFEVTIRIEKGYPVQEILKVEKEEMPSAIVLGPHGRSNIRSARIGSVAEKVIRRAVSTVLLIRH